MKKGVMMSVLLRLFGRHQGAGGELDRCDKQISAVSDGRRPVTVGDLTPEALQILTDVKKGQEQADAEDRAWKARVRRDVERVMSEKAHNSKYLLNSEIFREATLDDYNEWLLAWIKQGGKITHYSERPYPTNYHLVATDPGAQIELRGMYGAAARNFIIPKNYSFGAYANKFALGHCEVYGWQGGRAVAYDNNVVFAYSDTVDKQLLAVANSILGTNQGEIDE